MYPALGKEPCQKIYIVIEKIKIRSKELFKDLRKLLIEKSGVSQSPSLEFFFSDLFKCLQKISNLIIIVYIKTKPYYKKIIITLLLVIHVHTQQESVQNLAIFSTCPYKNKK
jgi:hypothetical protein